MLLTAKAAIEAGMRRCFRNVSNKSQALSELAIFGTLLIIGFGAVLSYVQSMNSQQSLQMEAFRKAYRLSRESDKEVSYTIIKDSPVVDVADLFGRPDTARITASADVVAMRYDPPPKDENNPDDRDNVQYYEINGQVYSVDPIKVNVRLDSGGDRDQWIAAPIADMAYRVVKQRSGAITKNENAANITTNRFGNVTVDNTTNLVLEDYNIFFNNYDRDLKDNVEPEPWERDLKSSETLYNLQSYIMAAIAAGLQGQINKWFKGHANSWCVLGQKAAMGFLYGSLIAMADEILGRLLDPNNLGEKTEGLNSISNYRGQNAVSGTKSFDDSPAAFQVTP
jgi:hypothetical protein